MTSNEAKELPEKFMGTFKLDRSENFEEFLASKDIHAEETKGAYNLTNLTSKKNTVYKNWKLNEEFQAEGLDGKMHKIKFGFNPATDSLEERHIRMNDPNDHGETYTYTVDGDTLVLSMANEKVSCRRYFIRHLSSEQ
ncbi:Fatty acid-binding-like protein 3 [Dirofilaria immitis]|nr:Fatty acid-binding-like protein 3 [Dirofilaria immitis]